MIARAVPLACLLQLIVYVSSQFVNTPCTKYFRLQKNDSTNEIFGHLEVPSTVENNAVNVSVNLSVATAFNTSYIGKIKLDDPLNTTAETIYRSKPLKYKIHFATQDPLPRITAVSLNNRQLCTCLNVVGPVVTNIALRHSLTLPAPLFSITSLPVSTTTPRTTTTAPSTTTKTPRTTTTAPSTTTKTPRTTATVVKSELWNKVELTKTQCGIRVTVTNLIVNGIQTAEGDWPWVVAIFKDTEQSTKDYVCAGTLLSDTHVLTAAHCVISNSPGLYQVVLGRNNVQEWRKDRSVNKEVQRIAVHPKYLGTQTADSDLAIITMSSRVKFNPNIAPICIWTGDTSMQDYVGQYGVVVGWGINETGVNTNISAKIEVQIASQVECLETYKDQKHVVTDRTFCAGRENAGPCNGDSGSGLVMKDNLTGVYYLRGIVSLSLIANDKCDLTKYVVYVNVAHYTNWIQQQITV